jgi:hypothetical protein
MSAQVGGTTEVYHESVSRRSINLDNTFCTATKAKPSNGRVIRRQLLMRELAYCRIKLCRARARRSTYGETWVSFYRDECARLRRCIDAKPRTLGVVIFPELRQEVRGWVEAKESEDAPW